MKLNIGCGKDHLDGYKNIDISKDVGADEVYDISRGIKEDDSSVDEINAGCVIEQIDDIKFIMNECWRVLKTGGILKGYVPSTDPSVLHLDPMDKHFFQEASFNYFHKHHNAWKQFGHNYGFMAWENISASKNENGIIHFTLQK